MEDKSEICNIIPSPFDARDWKYTPSNVVKSIKTPSKFLIKNLCPIKNQGSRGTCVAMAISCIKEYQETQEEHLMLYEELSPNSVYFYRIPKSGMYVRNALKILKEKGICTEHSFPYSKTSEPSEMPETAVAEALNYRIKSYVAINTIDEARNALLENGPLIIALPYYSNGQPEFWRKPEATSKIDGGHAVAIIGWDNTGFIIRNSWGETWNGNGLVKYPFDEWGAHWEVWSCADDTTNYIPDYVKNQNSIKKLAKKMMFCCNEKQDA